MTLWHLLGALWLALGVGFLSYGVGRLHGVAECREGEGV